MSPLMPEKQSRYKMFFSVELFMVLTPSFLTLIIVFAQPVYLMCRIGCAKAVVDVYNRYAAGTAV
jgi:hypothetical protein